MALRIPARALPFAVLLILSAGAVPSHAAPAAADEDFFGTQLLFQSRPGARKPRPESPTLQSILEARMPILSRLEGSVTVSEQGDIKVQVAGPVTEAQVEWFSRPGEFQLVWLPNVQGTSLSTARYKVSVYLLESTPGAEDALPTAAEKQPRPRKSGGKKSQAQRALETAATAPAPSRASSRSRRPEYRFFDTVEGRFVPVATVLGSARTIATGADLGPHGAAVVDPASSQPQVLLSFTGAGAKRLTEFGRKRAGETIALVLDGKIVAGPVAVPPRDRVMGAAGKITQRTGSLDEGKVQLPPLFGSRAEINYFVAILNSGQLPARLTRVEPAGSETPAFTPAPAAFDD